MYVCVCVCVETIDCTQYGQSFWVWKVKPKLTCTLSKSQQGATAPTVPIICKLMRKRPFFLLDWLSYRLQNYRFLMSLWSQRLLSSLLQHSTMFNLTSRYHGMSLLSDILPSSTVSSKYVHSSLQKKKKKTRWQWKYCQTWCFEPVVQNNGLHRGGLTLVSLHLKQIKKILFFFHLDTKNYLSNGLLLAVKCT